MPTKVKIYKYSAKKIYKYSLTGKFIAEYKSGLQAAKAVSNKTHPSTISDIIRRDSNYHKGNIYFSGKLPSKKELEDKVLEVKNRRLIKFPLYQYNAKGKFLRAINSVKEFEKYNKSISYINLKGIIHKSLKTNKFCINRNTKNIFSHIYKKQISLMEVYGNISKGNIQATYKDGTKIKFTCAFHASKKLKIPRSVISRILNKEKYNYASTRGYVFKYIK